MLYPRLIACDIEVDNWITPESLIKTGEHSESYLHREVLTDPAKQDNSANENEVKLFYLFGKSQKSTCLCSGRRRRY